MTAVQEYVTEHPFSFKLSTDMVLGIRCVDGQMCTTAEHDVDGVDNLAPQPDFETACMRMLNAAVISIAGGDTDAWDLVLELLEYRESVAPSIMLDDLDAAGGLN